MSAAVLACTSVCHGYLSTAPDKRQASLSDNFNSQFGGSTNTPAGMESEDITVPNRMVGLIIGRNGESINRLQAESGAKIQMASSTPEGHTERVCNLSGSRVSIERAKELIGTIIQSRVGERDRPVGGVSMGSEIGAGDPQPGQTTSEIMLPAGKVGLIIGKGGETIKQLQDKSGSRMVVIQDGAYASAPEKPLRITGDPHQIETAKQLVYDLMAEKDGFKDSRMAGGRGYGSDTDSRPGNNSSANNSMGWSHAGMYGHPRGMFPSSSRGAPMDRQEVSFPVPSAKCGVIIGRGGETIKAINVSSGAHCELDRGANSNPNEKIFLLKGNFEQVEHAKRLICEKIGMPYYPPNSGYGPGYGAMVSGGWPGSHAPAGYPGGVWGAQQPAGKDSWGDQYYSGGQYYGAASNQSTSASSQPGSAGQMNPQMDYSSQWVEYYRCMGMMREAEAIEQQVKMSKSLASGAAGTSQAIGAAASSAAQTAGVNGQQQQQTDYTAQWIDYYRSQGMLSAAEKLEQHVKVSNKTLTAESQQQGGAEAAAQPPDYTDQWISYYRSQGDMEKAAELEAVRASKQQAGNSAQQQGAAVYQPQQGTQQSGQQFCGNFSNSQQSYNSLSSTQYPAGYTNASE